MVSVAAARPGAAEAEPAAGRPRARTSVIPIGASERIHRRLPGRSDIAATSIVRARTATPADPAGRPAPSAAGASRAPALPGPATTAVPVWAFGFPALS